MSGPRAPEDRFRDLHRDTFADLLRFVERRIPPDEAEDAVGFVSYGSVGGARAVEHLRLVAGELMMADVRQQVTLAFATEFENYSVFTPGDYQLPQLTTLLDQVVAWSTALAPLRQA